MFFDPEFFPLLVHLRLTRLRLSTNFLSSAGDDAPCGPLVVTSNTATRHILTRSGGSSEFALGSLLGLWVCLVATWHQREMFRPRVGDPPHATLPPHPSSGKQTLEFFSHPVLKPWSSILRWLDPDRSSVKSIKTITSSDFANLHWREISDSNEHHGEISPNRTHLRKQNI